MSRLGKRPIAIPSGVTVKVEPQKVEIKGPKGTLQWKYPNGVAVAQEGTNLFVKKQGEIENISALWGLSWARISWMVEGVTQGFTKQLDIQGVGYRAKVEGSKLTLTIGNSHPVNYSIPAGLTFTVDQKQTGVTISGADKELVGLAASQIRSMKPPEPYKGKGIRYLNEQVTRKAGKTAATGGASKGK